MSRNFFVQTGDGTVCYYGEDVDIYANGAIVSHDGAWRAGVSGATAGILMPAAPTAGQAFEQEVAPGIAQDRVTIRAVGETTPLEPGASSTKVYASFGVAPQQQQQHPPRKHGSPGMTRNCSVPLPCLPCFRGER